MRRIQNRVRARRMVLDDLQRQQRQGVVVHGDARWSVWSRTAKLAAVRAEYEYWRDLLTELQNHA